MNDKKGKSCDNTEVQQFVNFLKNYVGYSTPTKKLILKMHQRL